MTAKTKTAPKSGFNARSLTRPEWAFFSRLFGETFTPTGKFATDMKTLENLCWRALAEKLEHVVSKYAQYQIRRTIAALGQRWSGSKGDILSDFCSLVLASGKATTQKSIWAWNPRRGGLGAYLAGRGTFAMHSLLNQRVLEAQTLAVGGFDEDDNDDDRILNMWTNESCHVDPVFDEVA